MPSFHRVVRAIAAIALAGACVDAAADAVIGAVGITSDHGDYDTVHNSYPLVNIINQSALSRTYVSGVTDFDSYVADTTGTVDNSNAGVGYTGSASKGPVVFTFDLGAVYRISGVAIWNKYPNYPNSQQIGDFELYADADGDPGDGLGTLLTSGTLNGDPSPANVYSFAPIETRYIELDALDLNSRGQSDFGLNEVVFDGSLAAPSSAVPEPGSLPLIASALLIASRLRSR